MKSNILLLLFSMFLSYTVSAQTQVYSLTVVPNKTVMYEGSLKNGAKIQDLSWAANSSVACFPATQNQKFTGNHVFYTTMIPKYSEMFITIIPKNKKQNFSLYAYMVGATNDAIPPNLNSCITCEADYKWDRKWKGKTQDHTRKVRLNAINRSYKVVFGVVGADGLTEGDFDIKIEVKSR